MADFEQLEKLIDQGFTDAWWLAVDGLVYQKEKSIQEIKDLESNLDYLKMDAVHVSHKENSKWIRIDENYATPSPPSYLRFINKRFGKAYALIKNSFLICLVGLGIGTLFHLSSPDDSHFFTCQAFTFIALCINFVVFLFKISTPVYSHKRVNKHEQSVKSLSLIKKIFNFRGRLNRLQYLIATFIKWISFLGIGYLALLLLFHDPLGWMRHIFVIILFILWILFSLSINIRRLHDMGRSAWYFAAVAFILFSITAISEVQAQAQAQTQELGDNHYKNIYGSNPWGNIGIAVVLVFTIRLLSAKPQNRQNPYGESLIKFFPKGKGVSANN
jgi:uncharacterized membrane protein YhaH (DUF805 family)